MIGHRIALAALDRVAIRPASKAQAALDRGCAAPGMLGQVVHHRAQQP